MDPRSKFSYHNLLKKKTPGACPWLNPSHVCRVLTLCCNLTCTSVICQCKQRRRAKRGFVGEKPFIVVPHQAAVAKRDYLASQTSVTCRGPYIPTIKNTRSGFVDKNKWLAGPWHIPAPTGSFTMRNSAFATASAVYKGRKMAARTNLTGKGSRYSGRKS